MVPKRRGDSWYDCYALLVALGEGLKEVLNVGRTLGLHTYLTWEWDPVFPCRSIVPVWVTTGIPLLLVGKVFEGVSGTCLTRTARLS